MKQATAKFLVPRGAVLVLIFCSLNLGAAQVIKERFKVKESPFTLSTSLELSSNLYDDSSNEKDVNGELGLGLTYSLSKTLTLSGSVKMYQEAQREKVTEISNTKISLTKTSKFKNFSLSQSLVTLLPTNEVSRNEDTFLFRAGYAPNITFPLRFLARNHTLTIGTSLYVNNHKFSQNNEGKFNSQYLNNNSISLASDLTSKLGLSVTAGYSQALNYAGTLKAKFISELATSYNLTKKTSVSLGLATEKSAFDYDGNYSNFEIFDNRDSIAFMNLTIIN